MITEDRFKFRVWRASCILLCRDYGGRMYHFDLLNEAFSLSKEDVLMQCTGLKDEDDTLIYEGDILSGINACSGEIIRVVKWLGAGWSPWISLEPGDLFLNIRILGNIHEHTHLLETKTQKESGSK